MFSSQIVAVLDAMQCVERRPMSAGRKSSSTVRIQVCRGHPQGLWDTTDWCTERTTMVNGWLGSCNMTEQRETSRANYFRARYTTSSVTASAPTSYYSTWHYNYLCLLKGSSTYDWARPWSIPGPLSDVRDAWQCLVHQTHVLFNDCTCI